MGKAAVVSPEVGLSEIAATTFNAHAYTHGAHGAPGK